MKTLSTSLYKIRETHWGIYIKIKANTENSNQGQKISENIFLEYQIDNINITEEEKDLLKAGLKWVSPNIEEKINSFTKITLTEIELNECDYQIEGMFYGIAFWASEHFGFDLPEYNYSYDKKSNKYIFSDLYNE